MLETFINLVSVLSEAGTINEAYLNRTSGMLTLDGITNDEVSFHLSCRYEKEQKHS